MGGKCLFLKKNNIEKVFCDFVERIKRMEENTIDSLYQAFYKKIARVSTRFRRYIYTDINWNNYVIGIKGARGVGKSTLIQQHIKESFRNLENVLYVSLDNLWFTTHSLTDLVTYFVAHNGTHLFLDEVLRYPNWQVVLKNLSDFYNQLAVKHKVHYPNKGDFRVDERYLFEVGGKSKTFEQIKDIPDSYLAVDGIEIGVHNRIPLWMFGLLY